MMKGLRWSVLLLGVLAWMSSASAQTSDSTPLMAMLALVPDTAASRSAVVSYADYRALEAVRGMQKPTADDFRTGTDLSRLWIAASRGLFSGMTLDFLIPGLEEMPAIVGFSFFDVNQSLVFGSPPGQGTVLAGDFNPEQIAEAYAARGFVAHDDGGVTLWCGSAGCDRGMDVNLMDRNLANPFGGRMGRHEPLAVLPGMVADSPDLSVLEGLLAAYHGNHPALADAPEYRTIAEAAAAHGQVVQIQFISPAELMTMEVASLRLDTEGQNLLKSALESYGTLPVYTLAALADVWDGSHQQALILLAYPDADTARVAADELSSRLEHFVLLSEKESAQAIFETLGGVSQQPAVYTDAETNTAIAVWALHYPVPANAPGDDGRVAMSSTAFRVLINAFFRRELYVLATSLAPMS